MQAFSFRKAMGSRIARLVRRRGVSLVPQLYCRLCWSSSSCRSSLSNAKLGFSHFATAGCAKSPNGGLHDPHWRLPTKFSHYDFDGSVELRILLVCQRCRIIEDSNVGGHSTSLNRPLAVYVIEADGRNKRGSSVNEGNRQPACAYHRAHCARPDEFPDGAL